MSPSDLGMLIKPFVFLDHVDVDSSSAPRFGWHPHSGIATLTLLLEGGFAYEDCTGAKGAMEAGSVEWMQAGGGVWHSGAGVGQRIKGYQLWVVLPPELENGAALSQYLGKENFPMVGPARVILGNLADAHSPIRTPSPMNYLDVRLKPGEVWHYKPPAGHDVAWIAVHQGELMTGELVSAGELAVFLEGRIPISFQAQGETRFILGSAAKHPFDLVMGYYSVHTNERALVQGEANIQRIGEELRLLGKL
jgi:redox-sensitive bicupin YhaK (pirin superfamily)